ncbi:hypothetical protein B0H19DRAFT_1189564 [Mycena capillaripes]|nr:hypothetical protein B0H19DRAFT_1189564 [Mycena capillaripes]
MALTAARWKNLHINLDSFLHFNDLPPATFEALDHLFVENFSTQITPVIAFQSSPHLRNFTLNTLDGPSKIDLFHLPWSQLTHLDVEDTSLGGCRTVLLQCSNVVWAKFETSYQWDLTSRATDSPLVTLPSLNRLLLDFSGIPNPDEIHGIEAFLVPLALPSLKTLKLDCESEFWPTQVFSEFQNRSQKIEEVSLRFSSINSEGIIALLRHGPALTTLWVE